MLELPISEQKHFHINLDYAKLKKMASAILAYIVIISILEIVIFAFWFLSLLIA